MRDLTITIALWLVILLIMPVWAQPSGRSVEARPANFPVVLCTLDDELHKALADKVKGVNYRYDNGVLTAKFKPRKFMIHELPMTSMVTTADSYAPAVEKEGPDATGFILRASVVASKNILQKPPEFYADGQYWTGKGWAKEIKGPKGEKQILWVEFSVGSKLDADIENRIEASVDFAALQLQFPTPKFVWNPMIERLNQRLDRLWGEFPLEAKVELVLDTAKNLEFRYLTQKFMVHHPTMIGEFQSAVEEFGPTLKGFVVRVEYGEGTYNGQAGIPQTLKGPYYDTFINAYAIHGQNAHFFVSLSYGRKCKMEHVANILKAIEEAAHGPR